MGKAENEIETYLDKQVRVLGGFTRKFKYIGRKGGADRLIVLFGQIMLVEVKTIHGTESALQTIERRRIRASGARAHCVYGRTGVDEWIRDIYSILGENYESDRT